MGRTRPHTTTNLALTILLLTITLALASCGTSTSTTTSNTTANAANANTTQPATPATTTTPKTTTTPATPTPAATATKTTSPTPPHEVYVDKIILTSPAAPHEGAIPARYTCDGADESLPFNWKEIPPNTKELALNILKTKPVNHQLYFAWAITHINPHTTQLNPGQTPPHTITATNTNGHTTYQICPPKGHTETYLAVLYALPHPLPTHQGYNPTTYRHQSQQDAEYSAHYYFTYTRH
jgi:phosphatidylethanolamine-binding protein (PEBP) family uncharacterized protein